MMGFIQNLFLVVTNGGKVNLKYWGLICVTLILFIFGLKNTFLKKRIALLIAKEEKEVQTKKIKELKEEMQPVEIAIKAARLDSEVTRKDYLLLKVQEEEIKERLKKEKEILKGVEKEALDLSATLEFMRNRNG